MSGGMPYHLEKGVLRHVERHLNCGREKMGEILLRLRAADGSQDWVTGLLPDLDTDPDLVVSRHTTGRELMQHFAEHWLGKVPSAEPGGRWQARDAGGHSGRTGYWTAYTGDVEQIVRKALIWGLELALGLVRGADPATRADAGEPAPVELFWMCPVNWLEAWVLRRPVSGSADTGDAQALVTICFVTPAHAGSDISEQPMATALTAATTNHDHAVPSIEDDYQQLDVPWAYADVVPNRPRVTATERQYATWVVTHSEHRPLAGPGAIVDNSAAPSGFGEWSVPRLNAWEGTGDVVIVSPSAASGGITHNGKPLVTAGE